MSVFKAQNPSRKNIKDKQTFMTTQKEMNGTDQKSKVDSKPKTSAKVRSKPSTVKATDVQLPETVEANSPVINQNANTADKWIKFVAWFAFMGVLLGYGIHQHDDAMLLWVMVVVTVGCGFGHAIEVLIKFLEAKGISPPKLPKS
jgi:hypothetical protein